MRKQTHTGTELLNTCVAQPKAHVFASLDLDQQTVVRAVVLAFDLHPIYAVNGITGGRNGVAITIATRGQAQERGALWYGGKAKAGAMRFDSCKDSPPDSLDVPVALDTLTEAMNAITDRLLAENPDDIELLEQHKAEPSMIADSRVAAAALSVIENLRKHSEKSKAAAHAVETGVLYVFPDLRMQDKRPPWRYIAVLGDKHFIGQQTQEKASDTALLGARRLNEMSDSGKVLYTIRDKGGERPDLSRVRIVTDELPPSKYWEEAEKIISEQLKPKMTVRDLTGAIDDVLKKAQGMSRMLAHAGAFGDARAFDEYILDAEKGKTALERISRDGSFGFSGFPKGMRTGMMFGPRW